MFGKRGIRQTRCDPAIPLSLTVWGSRAGYCSTVRVRVAVCVADAELAVTVSV